MINMKKTAIAAALLTAGTAAQAATVTSLTIDGGLFSMGDPSFAGASVIVTGDTAPLITGTYQGIPDTGATADFAGDLAHFDFGYFGPVDAYTRGDVEYDVNLGGLQFPAAPTGDASGSTINMDMSAWTAYWNGTEFNQGNNAATGTYDAVTGAYELTWGSYISGGAFDGQTGYWKINGTASVVPVPAAVWLFGSGLLGLVGVARRRKVA